MAIERRASPLRVLHYYPANYGMTGVESFILQLSTAQKRAGIEPGITIEIASREDLVNAAAKIGVPVVDFPKPITMHLPGIKKISKIVNRLRHICAMRQQLKSNDVLH